MVPTRRKKFDGNVSTDTRNLKKGDMFIAVRGKQFDGHKFIDEAFEKGARFCVAEASSTRQIKRKDPDIVFVDDSVQALGRLAAFHRRKNKIPVIAITGSCGKTTTKDLLTHFLSKKYKVLSNAGTENNNIGVPKTMLQLEDHDIMILELGTNQMGEIRHLARMCAPTHSILTMIGNAHLTGFRSLQGVKREKLSLLDALDDKSVLVYNADDKSIVHRRMKTLKTVKAGTTKRCDFYASHIELKNNGAIFTLNGKTKIESALLGNHNILNVVLAAAMANQFKITPDDVKSRLKSFDPPKGRIRYQEVDHIHWIDDSYNANPSSLQAAIELFKTYKPKGRKILVLGDMLELGVRAQSFHREAGRAIAAHPFDLVLTVGVLAQNFRDEAVFSGFNKEKLKTFPSSVEAGQFLKKHIKKDDTILLKGSRAMRMERIMELCGVPQ
jgi:UDP-N-acetylmuramoyl-tripeptide--D-alanyl-D-alanine ligase